MTHLADNFNGDNEKLVSCIEALLALDAAGALTPHGVGGHARQLLSAAAVRIEALEKALREIGSVEADPGDGTVKPNLEYVLIRGFSAMGWGQPSLAAHDILALAALAPEQDK
jgi:hypothetical protein